MLFFVRAAMLVLVAMFAPGQAPSTQPPPSYQFDSGSSALHIPFELIANGLVFVRAEVNGHPGWFSLDNATQGFHVDRQFAERSALRESENTTARGGGANAIAAGVVRDVQINLPGLELTHRNVVTLELKPLEPSVGHEVDGIIGSRLFDDFVVELDYEHRNLAVYLPAEYKPSGKGTAFPVRIDAHGFPYLEATIALPGVQPVVGSFLIDGGANTYADIYKPFSDAHQIPPSSMKLLDEPGTSTGGTTQSRDGRAELIRLGPYSIQRPPITFALDSEGLMASKEYAGLIGAEFLERFTVVFDNPNRRMWLIPNGKYAERAEYDASGLRIRAEGPSFHKFVVGRVLAESPARDAGIEPGDVIESIDNSPAEEMTLTELRIRLCRAQAHYVIGLVRGDSHLRVELRLRALL